jgi:hypothetical protein
MRHTHRLKSVFLKAVLATAALGGFLLAAGTASAKTNDGDEGHRRAAYSDWRFRASDRQSGNYSPQANYWRHNRREAYESPRDYRRSDRRENEWREQRRDRDRD